MFARFALAASLIAASLVPQLVRADSLAPCQLLTHAVTDVRAHSSVEHVGKVTVSHLDGASLFVAAQPGLTAEWLQRSLQVHSLQMRGKSMADCPLEGEGLKVSVQAAPDGYWVTIRAATTAQAKLVLEHATALTHPGK